MDPIGLTTSVAKLAIEAAVAIKTLQDLKSDSSALVELVRRVGAVVQDAAVELDTGKLSRQSAIDALQGLEDSMKECKSVVDRLRRKTTVVKFFTAGAGVAELKAVTLRLSIDLGTFQDAVGVEQHAELKKVFTDLRADLSNVRLEVMRGFEVLSAQLRQDVERVKEDARAGGRTASSPQLTEQIRSAVLASLEEAGLVKSASGVSAQDMVDITNALQLELVYTRQEGRKMEEEYISQLVQALTQNHHHQQQGASSATPQDFLCPITLCPMRDPVVLAESGHSFERAAIERHLASRNTNPVTNLPLTSKQLIPNIALRNSIQSWMERHGVNLQDEPSPAQQPQAPSPSQAPLPRPTPPPPSRPPPPQPVRDMTLLVGHSNRVRSVVWSPDGRSLASGGYDKTVRVWDVASGRCTATLEGLSGAVFSVVWSPDGRSLASGSYDKPVSVWDVASGRCTATLEGHSGAVNSVVWSPDGRSLASSSSDKTVRVWDVASGRCTATLEGHSEAVFSVVWSPDGRSLASSGSWDETVRVWDVASGRCTATLEGHSEPVMSVVWSPDGRSLASGGYDKTVRVWDVASGWLQ